MRQFKADDACRRVIVPCICGIQGKGRLDPVLDVQSLYSLLADIIAVSRVGGSERDRPCIFSDIERSALCRDGKRSKLGGIVMVFIIDPDRNGTIRIAVVGIA